MRALALAAALTLPGPPPDPPAESTWPVGSFEPIVETVHGHDARYWHRRFVAQSHRLRVVRTRTHSLQRTLRVRWAPTVTYALRLAASVSGVPESQLRTVSYCESTHNPFAVNGRYKGLFQLGWAPFGFSPFDPVANALSAALTVRRDGSWRQWECKP